MCIAEEAPKGLILLLQPIPDFKHPPRDELQSLKVGRPQSDDESELGRRLLRYACKDSAGSILTTRVF